MYTVVTQEPPPQKKTHVSELQNIFYKKKVCPWGPQLDPD